jgi:hypothetical protein
MAKETKYRLISVKVFEDFHGKNIYEFTKCTTRAGRESRSVAIEAFGFLFAGDPEERAENHVAASL